MDVCTAIRSRRTIRRYKRQPVAVQVLQELVELGRLYASGANLQPIRFAIVSQEENVHQVFSQLAWAAYLPEYEVTEQQQPAAYLVLLRDDEVKHSCQFDLGAAATTVMLAAKRYGLDSCCLGSFKAEPLKALLGLSQRYQPELVIALGYADEESEAVALTDSVRYYQTKDGALRVPKHTAAAVTVYSDIIKE